MKESLKQEKEELKELYKEKAKLNNKVYDDWAEEIADKYKESLKEIEKGRNSDWSKEFFIKQKAETLEALTSQLASVSASVEAQEEVLDTLTEQTEACVQKLVETEVQKEFMRYAFLKEPKGTYV